MIQVESIFENEPHSDLFISAHFTDEHIEEMKGSKYLFVSFHKTLHIYLYPLAGKCKPWKLIIRNVNLQNEIGDFQQL